MTDKPPIKVSSKQDRKTISKKGVNRQFNGFLEERIASEAFSKLESTWAHQKHSRKQRSPTENAHWQSQRTHSGFSSLDYLRPSYHRKTKHKFRTNALEAFNNSIFSLGPKNGTNIRISIKKECSKNMSLSGISG